jgi:hypothetical protein
MQRQVRELLLIALAALAVAIVSTWPISARFGTAGRLDSGDGRFSVWNVAWVARALATNPADLWNANIFAPHDHALAYSEANLVAGALAVPVWVLTRNPYAAMNSVILSSFVLAAVAMFALVRHLTGHVPSAAVSALLYAFCPFAFSHIPQVQLLMTFGPPLALLALHRFAGQPSYPRAIALGAALALQSLACGYYGIYGGLAVGLGVVWFGAWSGQWRRPAYWSLALLAAGVAAMLVLPFLTPYLDIRKAGFDRSMEEARLFRAGWRAYLASPLRVHQWLLRLLPSWREVLFPGVLPIVLAATAVLRASRARMLFRPDWQVLGFYLLLAGLAMWASFGPDAGLYALLYRAVPFMSLLRAPARFGLLVTLSVVVVGGLGLTSLLRALAGWRRHGLLLAILCYAAARANVGGLDLVDAPHVSKAYQWLAHLPRGIVAEFPYFTDAADRHRHTEYMLMSTHHWQPLVNGYSDYVPADAWTAMPKLATFPSRDAWEVLQEKQVRYVVRHWNLYDADERGRVRRDLNRVGSLVTLVEEPDTTLFQVLVGPASVTASLSRQ